MEMIQLQIQILVFLVIGWIFGKKGWLSRQTAGQLNFLVLNLILPCSIFNAFLTELNEEIIRSTFSILVLAIALQGLFWLLSRWCWKGISDRAKRINLEYATVSNNAGTLGMIIGEAAFGEQGLLYTSIYAIPLRIVMWSYGVALYSRQEGARGKQLLHKVITHPCMAAIFLGLLAMTASWYGYHLPALVTAPIAALGKCNTVLIMLVIGVILSDLSIRDLFTPAVSLYTLLRLVLFPALTLLLLWLLAAAGLPAGGMPLKICVLETAMPAPVTMAMLSQKYRCDEQFAGKLIFLSTTLSMITLPLWTFLLQLF